jgi:hypothetical protein
MISLHHCWGWQPPQTASPIHLRHMQSVWTHWYAVHRHMVAALHSYPPYLAQIWGFWVTCGVEAEADSHLKLHPTSILDIYKVFEHIKMLSIGMRLQPYTAIHPTWLSFGGAGSLMELKWCHYNMVEADSYIKLLPASILDMYKVFEHIGVLSIGIW